MKFPKEIWILDAIKAINKGENMKKIKLTKIEKAIIILSEHVERCPYNDYKIVEQIIDVLGYKKIKNKEKKH